MKKKNNLVCVGDYVLIEPDVPTGGSFSIADGSFIDEKGKVISVGAEVSEKTKELLGKNVLFNAWACDVKKIGEVKYYFASDSANAICAIVQ